jgi:hypothetical protein
LSAGNRRCGVQGYELQLFGIPKHGGGKGPAEIDIHARPAPIGIFPGKPRVAVTHPAAHITPRLHAKQRITTFR